MATTEELAKSLVDIAFINATMCPTPEFCFSIVQWDDPPTDELVHHIGLLNASMIIAGYLVMFINKKVTNEKWDMTTEEAFDKLISEELAYLKQAKWHYSEETLELYEQVAGNFQGAKWQRLSHALDQRTLADNENPEDPYNILDRVAYTLYLKNHDKQLMLQFKIQTLNAFAWLCHGYPWRLGINETFIGHFFTTSFSTGLSMNLPAP